MRPPPTLLSPALGGIDGVRHAFFTRRGGVSQGLYASLNVGVGSGDDPAHVAENRRRAAAALGADEAALTLAYQVHSSRTLVAEEAWSERPQGDAVVTRREGLVCGVVTADCAPVLLADPAARVIAAVHAGWRGALSGIVASAVAGLVDLGAEPGRLVAAIGPCIAQPSYEVGLEFVARFEGDDPQAARFFQPAADPGKRLFDLAGFVEAALRRSGVATIDRVAGDTAADEMSFFSNRRATLRGEGDYGRLLSAIVLDPAA